MGSHPQFVYAYQLLFGATKLFIYVYSISVNFRTTRGIQGMEEINMLYISNIITVTKLPCDANNASIYIHPTQIG